MYCLLMLAKVFDCEQNIHSTNMLAYIYLTWGAKHSTMLNKQNGVQPCFNIIVSAIRGANLVQFSYVMESGQSYQPD